MSSAPDEDVARKQYEHVLQEYRFQVQLNWDRSKHYLTFNTAVLGAAVALAASADTWSVQAGRVALFVVCAANSFVGQRAALVGHQYYQRIRHTKSELEKALGLEAYAIQSTPGMMRDHDSIAKGTPPAREHRFASIVWQTRALLGLLCVVSMAGALLALFQMR
ncbi:MAG TPA: hypothetical protein VER33_21380 [Polyangiaceae bacterium]|nr:hypothetical protein [Polyangiaceae bacterium]